MNCNQELNENIKVLLVAPMAQPEHLKVYCEADTRKLTKAFIAFPGFEKNFDNSYPGAKVYTLCISVRDFIHSRNGRPVSKSQISKFFNSEYFVNAAILAERLGASSLNPNEVVACCIEALRESVGILDEIKPTHIIFGNVPHDLQTYVIYALAKIEGIPLKVVKGPEKYFSYLWIGFDKVDSCILTLPIENQSSCMQGLSEVTQIQIKKAAAEGEIPAANKDFLISDKGIVIFRNKLFSKWKIKLMRLSKKSASLRRLCKKMKLYSSKYRYFILDNLITCAPPHGKYVYFPLPYQPEMTTMPIGGIYSVQSVMLRMLLDGLPDDYIIVLKEHPRMFEKVHDCTFSHYRGEAFFSMIEKSSKIKVAAHYLSSSAFIRSATAVATISGAVLQEAMASGVPVLCFGNNIFSGAPGVHHCEDWLDVRNAIELSAENNTAYSVNNLAYMLKKMEQGAAHVPDNVISQTVAGNMSGGKRLSRFYATASMVGNLNIYGRF